MTEVTQQPVLVLNRNWTAVHVCTVRRAISLIYQGFASIVDENYQTYDFDQWVKRSESMTDDEPRIHAPQFSLQVPHVIVLGRYQKSPPRAVRFNRRNVYVRDAYACQYCGKKPGRDKLTLDHIIPRSRGGRLNWENIVVACVRCNTRKGNKLPGEANMKLKKKPAKPSWTVSLRLTHMGNQRRAWERFVEPGYWQIDPGQ